MILAKDLLKKEGESPIRLPVTTHPAFENFNGPMFLSDEISNAIISKWESENCEYQFIDGELELVVKDGVL